MSPRVQLVLYPDGDSAFASTTTLSLQIDLPAGTTNGTRARIAEVMAAAPPSRTW
mgnify:CR=1 FL=1